MHSSVQASRSSPGPPGIGRTVIFEADPARSSAVQGSGAGRAQGEAAGEAKKEVEDRK